MQSNNLLNDISGWTDNIHNGLRYLALNKFGENPTKNDITSWGPTANSEANEMLDRLVGAYPLYPYGVMAPMYRMRLIHRVLIMNELYKFITTGDYDRKLIEKIRRRDYDFYSDSVIEKQFKGKLLGYKP